MSSYAIAHHDGRFLGLPTLAMYRQVFPGPNPKLEVFEVLTGYDMVVIARVDRNSRGPVNPFFSQPDYTCDPPVRGNVVLCYVKTVAIDDDGEGETVQQLVLDAARCQVLKRYLQTDKHKVDTANTQSSTDGDIRAAIDRREAVKEELNVLASSLDAVWTPAIKVPPVEVSLCRNRGLPKRKPDAFWSDMFDAGRFQ
jgi:hypothetical protein